MLELGNIHESLFFPWHCAAPLYSHHRFIHSSDPGWESPRPGPVLGRFLWHSPASLLSPICLHGVIRVLVIGRTWSGLSWKSLPQCVKDSLMRVEPGGRGLRRPGCRTGNENQEMEGWLRERFRRRMWLLRKREQLKKCEILKFSYLVGSNHVYQVWDVK